MRVGRGGPVRATGQHPDGRRAAARRSSAHGGWWAQRLFLAVAGLVLSLLFTRGAAAKDRVIAVYVEGPDADAVRSGLATGMPQGTTLADSSGFRAALAQQGQKLPFGKALDGRARDQAVSRARKAAAAAGLDAAVVGRVTKDKKSRHVLILLIDPNESGVSTERQIVLGAKRAKGDDSKLASTLRPALDKYGSSGADSSAPPASAPRLDEQAEAKAEAKSEAKTSTEPSADAEAEKADKKAPEDAGPERPRGSVARSLFEIEIDGEMAGRHLGFKDGITRNLRSYSAFPAPIFSLAGELYPLAGSPGILGDIGVVGSFGRSFFLQSTVGTIKASTTENVFNLGVRLRLHPAGPSGPIIGISERFASQSLDFAPTGTPLDGELPAVSYKALRTGVDARIPVGSVALLVGAGYRAVLDAGPIASRFRSSSVGGVDIDAGGALGIARGWEIRLVAHYDRYFYTFKPKPGDPFVAGGALDEFFGVRVGLAFIF